MCEDSSLYIGCLLYHMLRGVEENSHEIVQFDAPGPEYCGTLDSLYDGGEAVISVIGGVIITTATTLRYEGIHYAGTQQHLLALQQQL